MIDTDVISLTVLIVSLIAFIGFTGFLFWRVNRLKQDALLFAIKSIDAATKNEILQLGADLGMTYSEIEDTLVAIRPFLKVEPAPSETIDTNGAICRPNLYSLKEKYGYLNTKCTDCWEDELCEKCYEYKKQR